VILELDGADPARLAEALAITHFEATQRSRRGSFELWRSLPTRDAGAEAARLVGHGIPAVAIPESDVREACRPVIATGGRVEGTTLSSRTVRGALRIEGKDVVLLVQGEIVREYATASDVRRARTATLDPGRRIHVHLRESSVPLEIDPGSFDFGDATLGRPSFLTLMEWLRAIAPSAPSDDGFRRLVPALAPSEGDLVGPVAVVRAFTPTASRRGKRDTPVILDNLAQFRFYSAWRGAVARMLAGGGPR
jgi:hypothetical protein